MKKFNKLTEKQMSKTNGGFVVALIVTAVSTAAGLGVAAGIDHAVNKKDKN